VISLGDNLGFAVLAEGVETEDQFELLVQMGCQQMQGYLLTPPVSAPQAAALLTKRWGARLVRGPRRVETPWFSASAT
jgi:EAL domain-containing protein (putative c-di-GMP-specific phosphodiesterase class I)